MYVYKKDVGSWSSYLYNLIKNIKKLFYKISEPIYYTRDFAKLSEFSLENL